jgi:hypothetical protein
MSRRGQSRFQRFFLHLHTSVGAVIDLRGNSVAWLPPPLPLCIAPFSGRTESMGSIAALQSRDISQDLYVYLSKGNAGR